MVCSNGHHQNFTVQIEQENGTTDESHQVSRDLLENGLPAMPVKDLLLNCSREVNVIPLFSSNFSGIPLDEFNKQIRIFYNDKITFFPFTDFVFPQKSRNNSQTLKKKIKCFLERKCESIYLDFVDKFHSLKITSENVYLFMLPTLTLNYPVTVSTALWENYRKEILRVHTFSRYPINSAKSALLLAADGFVYIGNGGTGDDAVACYSCRKQKKNWLPGDDIHEDHRRLDPGCPMITGVNCNNEPLMGSLAALFKASSGENEAGVREPASTDPGAVQVDGAEGVQAGVFNARHENEIQPSTLINPSALGTLDGEGDSNHLLVQMSLNPATVCSANSDYHNEASEITYLASTNREELIPTNSALRSGSQTTSSTHAAEPVNAQPTSSGNVTMPQRNSLLAPGGTGNMANQELGIITERPKRPEYALKSKRLETYANSWPKDHHLKPMDLTEAGFYYAGYGDCARCFYCGGGLRNWEDDDHEWVEHARWFPKCAYVRQQHGQVFVDVVQELHKTNDKISYQMVMDAMGGSFTNMEADNEDLLLKRDPAVRSLIELGYSERDVLDAAIAVKDGLNFICAESLLKKLISEGKNKDINKPVTINSTGDLEARTRHLKERNNQLRQQTVCKICLDKEVAVVFLPCGHLVSCAECASAMGNCPYCRERVQGIVRAFLA